MIQNTFGKKPTTSPQPAEVRAAVLAAFLQRWQYAPAVLVMRRLRSVRLRNALVALIVAVDLSPAFAALAALLRAGSDFAHLPPVRPALVLVSATPNGPNTSPASASAFPVAVGQEIVAH